MRVLVTGAFGNIGASTLHELIDEGHQVRGFDLDTKRNRETARTFGGRVEAVWGDPDCPYLGVTGGEAGDTRWKVSKNGKKAKFRSKRDLAKLIITKTKTGGRVKLTAKWRGVVTGGRKVFLSVRLGDVTVIGEDLWEQTAPDKYREPR